MPFTAELTAMSSRTKSRQRLREVGVLKKPDASQNGPQNKESYHKSTSSSFIIATIKTHFYASFWLMPIIFISHIDGTQCTKADTLNPTYWEYIIPHTVKELLRFAQS